MGSTYTTSGGIEKIGLGEQSGTWGTTTNKNFDIIDRLTNGVGSVNLASSGNAHDLVTSDGSLSDGMFKVITFTNATQQCTITIKDETAEKLYFVRNSSGQNLIFKQGSSGTTVTLADTRSAIISADGGGATNGNVVDISSTFLQLPIDNVVIGGTTPAAITGTTITATQSILPDASGDAEIGSASAEFGHIFIADDKFIKFGSDQDVTIGYDETTSDTLQIAGGDISIADDKKLFFGTDKDVSLEYDEDDTDTILIDRSSGSEVITIADDKKVIFGTNKDVSLEYDEDGTDSLLVTGNVTFADGTTDVDIASHDGTNGLKLGGDLVTASATELNKMDGVTRTTAQINAARSGTVTSVSGGTGLSGTVTSSGSLSLNTGLGQVGTYAFLGIKGSNADIIAGQTYTRSNSGSAANAADNKNINLIYTGMRMADNSDFDDDTALDLTGSVTTGLTGLWRAMGDARNESRRGGTLFLRIQ